MLRLGLVVNPIAGMGGSVALKGTDGEDILKKAIELGAVPRSAEKVRSVFASLVDLKEHFQVYTCFGSMGEESLSSLNLSFNCVYRPKSDVTGPLDTLNAVDEIVKAGVDLMVFAGGDGTARDVYSVVESGVPVLGIPSGVKIHSAVYAKSSRSASELLRLFLSGKVKEFCLREVIDLDESSYREGKVKTDLFGYMNVPKESSFMQDRKTGRTPDRESYELDSIATYMADSLQEGVVYLLGSGSTVKAVSDKLNLEGTLLGVDAVLDGQIIGSDMREEEILSLLDRYNDVRLVVTLIGGQGYIFGRGNQQISPVVLRRIGLPNISILSTPSKLNGLFGKPLLVDTGDIEVDDLLSGYVRVIDGYNHSIVRKVQG